MLTVLFDVLYRRHPAHPMSVLTLQLCGHKTVTRNWCLAMGHLFVLVTYAQQISRTADRKYIYSPEVDSRVCFFHHMICCCCSYFSTLLFPDPRIYSTLWYHYSPRNSDELFGGSIRRLVDNSMPAIKWSTIRCRPIKKRKILAQYHEKRFSLIRDEIVLILRDGNVNNIFWRIICIYRRHLAHPVSGADFSALWSQNCNTDLIPCNGPFIRSRHVCTASSRTVDVFIVQ